METKKIPKFSLTQLWRIETDTKKPFQIFKLATCPICNTPVENRFDDPNGIGLRCSSCIQKNIWPFVLGQNFRVTNHQHNKGIIEFELLVDNKWYAGQSDAKNPWAIITINGGGTNQSVAVAINNKIIAQMEQATIKHH